MGSGRLNLSPLWVLVVQILQDSRTPWWVVEHQCFPCRLGPRRQRLRDQCLVLHVVLDLCHAPPPQLPSKRTSLLSGLVPFVLDAVHVPKIREYLCLSVHLQKRTSDPRHRHPRRHRLPIARFCFALAFCATNCKLTATRKRCGTAMVVGDQSIAIKRFIFVKKVKVLQGCLYIFTASVITRWEGETAYFWAKQSWTNLVSE